MLQAIVQRLVDLAGLRSPEVLGGQLLRQGLQAAQALVEAEQRLVVLAGLGVAAGRVEGGGGWVDQLAAVGEAGDEGGAGRGRGGAGAVGAGLAGRCRGGDLPRRGRRLGRARGRGARAAGVRGGVEDAGLGVVPRGQQGSVDRAHDVRARYRPGPHHAAGAFPPC